MKFAFIDCNFHVNRNRLMRFAGPITALAVAVVRGSGRLEAEFAGILPGEAMAR